MAVLRPRKNKLLNPGFYVCFSLLCLGFLDTASSYNKKANSLYQQKRYESALETYRKAEVRDPDRPEIRYNVGTALYQLDHFQEAEEQLKRALTNAKPQDLRADAWYNYGNSQFRLGQFEQAIEAYKNTLELRPDDEDAKYNLELLQKKKSLFNKKQDERDENRKSQQPKPRPQDQKQQQRGQQQKPSPGGGQGEDQDQESSASQGQEGSEQSQREQSEGKESDQDQQGKEKQDLKGLGAEAEKDKEEKEEESRPQPRPAGQEDSQSAEPLQIPRPEPRGSEKKESGEEREQAGRPLYQGQMSKQDAVRILNALRDSEQQLQILRRPEERQSEYEPEKDW